MVVSCRTWRAYLSRLGTNHKVIIRVSNDRLETLDDANAADLPARAGTRPCGLPPESAARSGTDYDQQGPFQLLRAQSRMRRSLRRTGAYARYAGGY